MANGQTLIADIVLSAIGLQPNISLAQSANIQTSRGVITNSLLETNQADIYAIGDCAEVNGTLSICNANYATSPCSSKNIKWSTNKCTLPCYAGCGKTPAAPLTVLPAPVDLDVNWETEEFDDGMLAKAIDNEGTLRGFVLLGATAGKQRLTLTKLVPDLIPAQA